MARWCCWSSCRYRPRNIPYLLLLTCPAPNGSACHVGRNHNKVLGGTARCGQDKIAASGTSTSDRYVLLHVNLMLTAIPRHRDRLSLSPCHSFRKPQPPRPCQLTIAGAVCRPVEQRTNAYPRCQQRQQCGRERRQLVVCREAMASVRRRQVFRRLEGSQSHCSGRGVGMPLTERSRG